MLKLSSQGKTYPPLKQATIVVNEVTHSMRMSGQCPGGLKFVCFRFIKYSMDPCALVVSPATLKDTICNEVDHWSKPMLHSSLPPTSFQPLHSPLPPYPRHTSSP